MQVTHSEAKQLAVDAISVGLVPFMKGSPAIGKSSIGHELAKDFNLKIIDLRLSQCDPTDLLGFPRVNAEGRGSYAPMETFPIEGQDLPKDAQGNQMNGWLLFLDEMNSASREVQAASYKLVLDRMVGTKNLHKKVAILAAGNKETDGAIVEPMSTALQSRLVHMELVINTTEWLDWAAHNQFDPTITSFIGWKEEMLYSFRPDHTDDTYASPRTWEFANRFLKGKSTSDPLMMKKLAGTLSEGVAREFIGYSKVMNNLPTLTQIMADPLGMNIPTDLSTTWALSGMLASKMDDKNAAVLMQCLQRLPIELQVFGLRDAIRRTPTLKKHNAIVQWVVKNGQELF